MSFGYYDYTPLRFSNLSDSKDELYVNTERQSFVTQVNIVNMTDDIIWISGKVTGVSGESFFDYRRSLKPRESLFLDGLPQLLNPNDNLLIFSDSYEQLFDCTVTLQILNERNDVV